MRKIVTLFYIASLFLFSCEQSEHINESRFDLNSLLNNYCLGAHLDDFNAIDQNAILFAKEHRWDTSFVIMLRKESDNNYMGVYYETSPENELLSDVESSLYFYEGVSFKFDSILWNKILKETRIIIKNPNHEIDMSCVDCESFVLVHDKEYTLKNSATSKQYMALNSLIKLTLINPIHKIRRDRLRELYNSDLKSDTTNR
jgi:hypothetical protein